MDQKLLQQIIGYRIVESRWALCMEQNQLATECNKDKSYLSRIEHGKVLAETKNINLIAEKLHKEPWQLMKPWKNTEQKMKDMKFVIKKYRGYLPPWVKKKSDKERRLD